MRREGVYLRDDAVATRVIGGAAQLFVVFAHVAGDFQFQLRQRFPVLCFHCAVDLFRHVQDHVVVVCVLMMPVGIPVRGAPVYFYVAHPQRVVQLDFRVEKVRSGVAVEDAGVYHLQGLPVRGLQFAEREEFVFPNVMQQLFHGGMAERFIFTNKSNEFQGKSLSLL